MIYYYYTPPRLRPWNTIHIMVYHIARNRSAPVAILVSCQVDGDMEEWRTVEITGRSTEFDLWRVDLVWRCVADENEWSNT